MHFRTTIIILSLVTDIVTHTYLKPIGMRFLSGQGILELKETQGKKTSGKWRLPSLIMCMYSPKEYFSTTEEQHLNNYHQSVNSHWWEDYAFHLGKNRIFFFRSFL